MTGKNAPCSLVSCRLKTEPGFLTFSYLDPHKRCLNYNILAVLNPSEQLPGLTWEHRQVRFLTSSIQEKGRKEEREEGKNNLLLLSVLAIWSPRASWALVRPRHPESQESQASTGSQADACVSEKQRLVREKHYTAQSDTPKRVFLLLLLLGVV